LSHTHQHYINSQQALTEAAAF